MYRRTITRKFEPIAVRFTVNVCNIVNDGDSSLLFKFIPNLYGYVKDIFQPCPWKKVTKLTRFEKVIRFQPDLVAIFQGHRIEFPEQVIDAIPRSTTVSMYPAGYYKFHFRFFTKVNLTLATLAIELDYRGY
jgi:hypothetical protein